MSDETPAQADIRRRANEHRRKTKLAVSEAIRNLELASLIEKLAAVQELTLNPPGELRPIQGDKGYQCFRLAVQLQLLLGQLYQELTPGQAELTSLQQPTSAPCAVQGWGERCQGVGIASARCK